AGAGLRPAGDEGRRSMRFQEEAGPRGKHGFPRALAAVLELVPRRHRSEFQEGPAAARVLVGELGLDVVPDDLERAALDLVVEPRPAEHELAQPVDERLAADER